MPKIINKDRLEIRPYQSGDESEIRKLFRISFGRELSEEYWQWRFLNNPARDTLIELAWDGDRLAGHYAVSPARLTIEGSEYLAGLSMTTMTHPDYRGLSLFPLLAKTLYDRMKNMDYLMVRGYPNNQSHRGFVRDLAWKNIYEIPIFRADVDRVNVPTHDLTENVSELNGFDQRFDVLLQSIQAEKLNKVMVKRDIGYLTWRFSENPINKYSIYGYRESGNLLGYVVYKKYEHAFDIVDLITVPDIKIGADLITAVIVIAKKQGIRRINMWLPINHPLHIELETFGFYNDSLITYWGGRLLDNQDISCDPLDYRNWHYSMADSDVY